MGDSPVSGGGYIDVDDMVALFGVCVGGGVGDSLAVCSEYRGGAVGRYLVGSVAEVLGVGDVLGPCGRREQGLEVCGLVYLYGYVVAGVDVHGYGG